MLESETEKIAWLSDHLDPKEQVLQYWQETFDARIDSLKKGISISDYYNNYKALGVSQAVQLVSYHIYYNRTGAKIHLILI